MSKRSAQEADELYGLALERFVPERGALAKALRAEGRRDEAAAVAALRKPSVAAWAVNQLVRTQGRAVSELFEAGDELGRAQADVLAGRGDGRALRAAGERQRSAVDALVDAARGLLTSDGHELSAAVIERVGDTLQAAALDEGARAQVRDGRLERELRHQGLGLGEGMTAAAPAPRAPKKDAAEERSRKAARSAEAQARRRAERAAKTLQIASERRERAARALDEAESALEAAREEASDAAEAHARAAAELEGA